MHLRPSHLRSALPRVLTSALAAVALAAPLAMHAQEKIEFPAASPLSTVKQRVGLTDIEVTYSRPSKNDRTIYGGLVPYGKVWRTGANAPTKIKFSNTVKIGDKEVPAGEYVLLSIPTADSWTVIFSKDAQMQSASDYKEENDAARVMAKPTALPNGVETFTIGFADLEGASATMHLDWDKTRVAVPVSTNDIERVSQQLTAVSSGTTPLDPRTAYQAATFYLDNNKDMNQALKWIDQALEKNPDAYFMHMRRAQIQAKLGNKKEATASAQKTIDILNKDKSPDSGAIATAQQIIDASK
jgi:hypothetical protein